MRSFEVSPFCRDGQACLVARHTNARDRPVHKASASVTALRRSVISGWTEADYPQVRLYPGGGAPLYLDAAHKAYKKAAFPNSPNKGRGKRRFVIYLFGLSTIALPPSSDR